MNEQDFFRLTDDLRADFIAEAADWKYRQSDAVPAENEISAIFERALRHSPAAQESEEPAPPPAPKPVTKKTVREQPEMPHYRLMKPLAFALTAAAAAIAVTVGIVSYFAQKPDSPLTGSAGSPGTAMSEEICEQTGIVSAGSALTDSGDLHTTAQTDPSAEENGSGTELKSGITDSTAELTIFTGENFLGGTGHIHPLSNLNFEDAEYWYYENTRIRKDSPDENGVYHNELICQKAGCSHQNRDCPLAKFNSRLLTDGESILYESSKALLRMNDDGSVEPYFNLRQKADGTSYYDDSALTSDYTQNYGNLHKLGDTGKFFVQVATHIPQNNDIMIDYVIFQPGSDDATFLDVSFLDPEATERVISDPFFDTSTGLLWAFAVSGIRNEIGAVFNARYSIAAFDIETGALVQNTPISASPDVTPLSYPYGAYVYQGIVYGMSKKTNNAGLTKTAFLSIDTKTGATEILEESTSLSFIWLKGDQIFGLRNHSTGADTLFRANPDGSGEETVYSYKNRILHADPGFEGTDFVFLQQSNCSVFLCGGIAYNVKLDSF